MIARIAISAIVVNVDRREHLAAFLASLERALDAAQAESELIVVDNGSTDGSDELVRRRFPDAVLKALAVNRGFAGGVVEGLRGARGEWILLVNNDATLEPDAVAELLAVARERDVGSVAAQMRFAGPAPVLNSAGLDIDRLGVAYDRLLGHPLSSSDTEPVEVFGASAGAALYRRAMLDQVGGFDESFFAFLEDADVAWRARMYGWRSLYAPGAVAHHHHSVTARHGSAFKHHLVGRNRVRLLAKNATTSHLRRYGAAMVAYDLAYVAYAAAADRTLAPLRGRIAGLREWRRYRRAGAPGRREVELLPTAGWRGARARRDVWLRHSATGGGRRSVFSLRSERLRRGGQAEEPARPDRAASGSARAHRP